MTTYLQPPRLKAVGREILFAAMLCTPVLASVFLLSSYQSYSLATTACVLTISAYGLQVAYGQAGLMFLAHGALYGFGAYSAGLLSLHLGLGFYEAVPTAMIATSAIAVALGIPSLRLTGHTFLVVTFMFTLMAEIFANNFDEVTKGTDGLLLVSPRPTLGPIDFVTTKQFFWLALVAAYVAMAIALIVARSRLGLLFSAVRENVELGRAVGINVRLHQLTALAIAGSLAGFAGVVYMYHVRAIEPSQFTIWATAQTVLIVLLGGRYSLAGPPTGAIIVVFLPDLLGLSPNTSRFVYGSLIVAIILLFPMGVAGTITRLVDIVGRVRGQIDRWMAEGHPFTQGSK